MADDGAPVSYEELAALEDEFNDVDTEISSSFESVVVVYSDLSNNSTTTVCHESTPLCKTSVTCVSDTSLLAAGVRAGSTGDRHLHSTF